MELDIRSDVWRNIWANICNDWGFMQSRTEAEYVLAMHHIEVIKDCDGRWERIKLDMTEEDLTIFLIKWSGT